jgi:hypothetical protein
MLDNATTHNFLLGAYPSVLTDGTAGRTSVLSGSKSLKGP